MPVDKKIHQVMNPEPIAMGTGSTKTACGLSIPNPDRVVTDLNEIRRESRCGRCLRALVDSDRNKLNRVRQAALDARDKNEPMDANQVLAITGMAD